MSREIVRAGIVGIRGNAPPVDLSWFDYSVVRDLSADGKTIIFSESGEAGGAIFGVYLRGTDGSPAIRLGDGTSEGLSPDGKWVLSIPRNRKPAQITMLPTGTGQPRQITHDRINHRNARWMPDGAHIFFQGNEERQPPRLWIQALNGSAPRPVSPENVAASQVTPDGRFILGRRAARHTTGSTQGLPESVWATRVRAANPSRSRKAPFHSTNSTPSPKNPANPSAARTMPNAN